MCDVVLLWIGVFVCDVGENVRRRFFLGGNVRFLRDEIDVCMIVLFVVLFFVFSGGDDFVEFI